MTRKDEALQSGDLTYKIRGAVYTVYKELGAGFLESVYEKALMIELARADLHAESQCPFEVQYKGQHVGKFFADILVENSVVVELKAQQNLNLSMCRAQLLNYLKASDLQVGLIVNFTYPKASVERVVL